MDTRRYRLAAAGLIALAATAMVLVARGGFFYQDDFLFLRQGHDATLSFDYLRQGAFGHFFPGFRATFWLQDRTFGLKHGWAVAIVAVFHVALMVAMARLLSLLFGRRPATLALLGVFCFSGLWLSGYLWWVSAIQVMPAMLLTILAVDAHVRFLLDRRLRHVVVVSVALAVAFCFYEKPAQLLVLLPLLTVLAFSDARRPREVVRVLVRQWPMWAGIGVVVLLYAVAYVTGDFFFETVHPTAGTFVRTVALSWHQGFVPAFLGGPVGVLKHGALGYPDPSRLLTIVDQLIVLGVVVASLRRRRAAWRGWAFFLTAFALNVAVIAWTRSGLLGQGVGRELKYLIDILPFAVLGVGLALLPLRVGPRAVPVPAPVAPRASRLPLRFLAAGLAAACFLAAFGVSAVRVAGFWHDGESAMLGRGIAASRPLPAGPDILYLDQRVSEGVLAAAFQPYQRHSVLLPLFGLDLRYAGQATRLLTVEKGGTIGPRDVPAQTALDPATATIDGQPLAPDPSGAACIDDDADHLLVLPLSAPLPAGRPYLQLDVRVPRRITLRFPQEAAIGDATIHPAERVTPLPVDASGRPLYLPLEDPHAAGVQILVKAGNPVCVRGGHAGVPVP
ncbi:MAG: hypothetical protein JWM31_552 [Solirubrobacterales bacterium]|nr:hypothetical protein [Solirubrobacterales bacterium]